MHVDTTKQMVREMLTAKSEHEPTTVDRDAPLRLAVAAKLAFPKGGMTAAGLRREADKGRLVLELIAGKYFTTLANIERMRELCRVEARPQQPEKLQLWRPTPQQLDEEAWRALGDRRSLSSAALDYKLERRWAEDVKKSPINRLERAALARLRQQNNSRDAGEIKAHPTVIEKLVVRGYIEKSPAEPGYRLTKTGLKVDIQ